MYRSNNLSFYESNVFHLSLYTKYFECISTWIQAQGKHNLRFTLVRTQYLFINLCFSIFSFSSSDPFFSLTNESFCICNKLMWFHREKKEEQIKIRINVEMGFGLSRVFSVFLSWDVVPSKNRFSSFFFFQTKVYFNFLLLCSRLINF